MAVLKSFSSLVFTFHVGLPGGVTTPTALVNLPAAPCLKGEGIATRFLRLHDDKSRGLICLLSLLCHTEAVYSVRDMEHPRDS